MSNRNIERLARELNSLKHQVNSMNTPQLAYSSLEDGSISEYDRDGRLVSIIGSQPDGTHGVVIVAGPVPPAPAGLQAVGSAGMFKVIWNGHFVDNNVAPMDYARIEIHISTEQGFAIDPLPGSQTRVATIESAGGGEVAIIRVPADYYVKAITRSLSGQYSEPSNEMQVHVESVVTDEELEAILDELNAARADLEDLQITLENVQTDLEDAEAILGTIGEIDGRLDNLDLAVIGLDTDVANATSAANNATTKADAASSLAGAAQTAANAAATAASNAAAEAGAATQAAQSAEQQALNAANLVADKSTVYWGMPEPAGDAHGLWIVDGKPHVWDGNAWVENTNPDVVQAVQDAADAKAQADAANTKATEAADRAADAEQAAQDAANSAGDALTAAQTAQAAAASAQLSAESAADLSGDAAAASQAASAAAGAAQLVAEAAEQVAQEAQDVADAASTTAQDALSEAANAALAATTAIGTANAATQAANAAQDSADTANSEALAAAGLAGSKGEVIYQATAPSGSRAVSQNLWIRTTDNKPHTYDGSKWVAVTDKTASDAAASAASANSAAQNAWNHANTANNTANTALSTANGKNKTTYSPNAPGSAANTAGDIWFRRSSTGTIIGQWEGLGGTAWAARTLDNQVIANLDAGKITTGFIDADRIQAGAITIGKLAEGSVATPSDLDTAMVTAAQDAQAKADAAKTAAETAAQAYADGEIDAAALAVAQQAASDATNKADAARQAAIDAAAADAEAKADAARDAAVITADLAAQIKADAAKDAAVLAAGQHTDSKFAPLNDTLTLWKHPGATLIDGGKIFTDSITANQIAAGAITANEIAANAVTAAKIHAGAIIAGKIDANAVTAGTIAAGAITAGTIAADAVVAGNIAADAITAREITALAIDTAHLKAEAVVADKIAAGAILADKIHANAVTADKIAADAITAGKIVALTITGDKIAANAISADKITANAITTDKLVANSVVADKIAANAIVAEKIAAKQILADHLQAGQINVGHLEAGTLSASNITAGIINASIGISTQGSLVAGNTNIAWSEMNSTAFSAYVVDNEAGSRTTSQIASIGQGQSFFSSTDADGNVMAAMTPAGDIGGQNLEVANIAQVGQHLVVGETSYDIATHGVGEFGPVINGQGLFDNQFLAHVENHPRLGANNKWMLGLAYGNVQRAQRNLALGAFTVNSVYRRELLSFKAELLPGRRYNLRGYSGLIRRTGGSLSTMHYGLAYIKYSSAGEADAGIGTGSTLDGGRAYFYDSGTGAFNTPHIDAEFVGGQEIPAGMTTFTLILEIYGGVQANHSSSTISMSLDDMGRHATDSWPIPTGFVHDSGGGGGTAPVPTPTKEYTETFTPSWTQVWTPWGINTAHTKGMIIAGRAGSDGANWRGYVGNMTNGSGRTMIQQLSGASIVKAEIYFVYRGIWNPNNVYVGLHNRHGTGTLEPTVTGITTVPVSAGQGKWLTIPSSRHAGLINGSFRGVVFGRKSGAPTSEKWAEIYRHDSNHRPRIRITYKK